jgi:endonuclease YncB( thermonuclease family)
LSLNRPRRIFRSFLPRIEPRLLMALSGAALIAAAAVSVAMLPTRGAPTQRLSAPVVGELTAPPAQVSVVDGGTLRLGDRVVLLRGVDPPRRDAQCGAQDCGAAAARALADLVRDTSVTCRLTGQDALDRPYGVCLAKGRELNQAMATLVEANGR